MTKIAATKTTKPDKVRQAKRAFLLGLLDLSWKLATAFLLPTFIGVALDQAEVGVIVGFIMAVAVIVKLALDSGKVQ